MNLKDKISAFSALGAFLRDFHPETEHKPGSYEEKFNVAIRESYQHNPWFTPAQITDAMHQTGQQLREDALSAWLSKYPYLLKPVTSPKRVGIVMAGNIPAVGFHDLLCVLLSGNHALVKLSSNDQFLIPFVVDFLTGYDPRFSEMVQFTERPMKAFDAVIATGSNNTSRYFESYFSKLPHIIRKNRNSVAVLNGTEGEKALYALCTDIFRYFGMGCRNVSHIFIPEGYDFTALLKASESYAELASHHKYASNYMYYKTIYIMNNQPFHDNGILMLKKENAYSSPVSVVYYSEYSDLKALNDQLLRDRDQLQCIVSELQEIEGSQPFGTTQEPLPGDYADGVDTLSFLGDLTNFDQKNKEQQHD